MLFHHTANDNQPAQLRLTCRDGKTGKEAWHFDIGPTNFVVNDLYKPSYPLRVFDVNDDGYADVLCPCFDKRSQPATVAINGKTGEPIWKLPRLSEGSGNAVHGWQTEIISAAGSETSNAVEASVVVTAWENWSSKPRGQLNVKFFNVTDGSPISTWKAEGKFTKPGLPYGMRSLTERVPLFIAEGDKRFAGIGIEADGKKELVVLDFSSDIAKEVRRII